MTITLNAVTATPKHSGGLGATENAGVENAIRAK